MIQRVVPARPVRVLVTHSYFLCRDPKQAQRAKPYPPLATLISAAALRQAGFEVHCFDAMLAAGPHEFEAALAAQHAPLVAILEDNFNFLTKMCTLTMREAALAMIAMARAHGSRVVVNGSDASDHPELYLGAGADAVITGAVEPTVVELAMLWRRDPTADPSAVAGLALPLASATGVRYTRFRPALEELDLLPMPAWDLVDAAGYRSAWQAAHGRLSWNMVTSRGCPYGCNWCAKPLFGRRYLQHSAERVAAEMRLLKDTVAPDHVWFADDIFGLTPEWIRSFARAVAAQDARTPFMIQSRANLMKPGTVAALRAAGAEEVWLGVESGSQRILDAMDKGTTIGQIRAATRALREQGIRTGWFLQLGYLGEDWSDLVRTRELVRDEQPDEIGVSVSYPLPGTPFHDRVQAQLGAKRNWQHTDDLDMLFHGTYVADFYRQIRAMLHDEVSARAAGESTGRFDDEWTRLARVQATFRNPAHVVA